MSQRESGEEWRPVPGWPYEASSLGRIRRAETGRILAPIAHTKGYHRVNLSQLNPDGGRALRRHAYVHELVCEAFHGPRPPGMQVDHRDTVRTNNTAANLRWLPAIDNATRYHAWYAERSGWVDEPWTEQDEAELAETLAAFHRSDEDVA